VSKWAEFLGVSRGGYYEYMLKRDELMEKEARYKEMVKDIYDDSQGSYGPGRICGFLRKQGYKASYRKVSRIMAELGITSIHNRRRCRSLTNSKKARGDGYKNLVRGKSFQRPYQAVCSDISYLKTGEGFLYSCIVKDIVTGEVLGQSTSANMKKELVIQAFVNAQARHPLGKGMIFHCDRGSQYTSKDFMSMLKSYGIRQSFSRVGVPGDNAWAESFFATFKKERIHFNHFATREEAAFATFVWIEGLYNTKRVQKRLGYVSPSEYRKALLEQEEKVVA